MDVREIFREFLMGKHRKMKLYYYIATSSGLPVTGDIPVLIGKRVGWAARQGANFVEIAVGPPSMIIMDKEELINSARQLGLNYSFHPSEELGLDSSYITPRGGYGFLNAQSYLRQMVIAIGNFKLELERRTEGKCIVTSMNIHAANHLQPPFDERLAADVSVDPFGVDTRDINNSKIWQNEIFRERFWIGYLEEKIKEMNLFIVRLAELFTPELFRKKLEPLLEEYLMKNPSIRDSIKRILEREREEIEEKDVDGFIKGLSFQEKMGLVPEPVRENLLKKLKDDVDILKGVRDKFKKDTDILDYLIHSFRAPFINEDEIMKESFLFRNILPRWMPHSGIKEVETLWREITGLKSGIDPERAEKEFRKFIKDKPYAWDRIIAAVASCYVWGHITQVKEPALGVVGMESSKEVTIAELLDHYDFQITLESHFLGEMSGKLRLYLPADLITVAKVINNTVINGKKRDVARVTIDMEQISTSGIDPLITIDPEFVTKDRRDLKRLKELGIRWIKGKDEGKLIRVMHVTHPYITGTGAGHQHGPIRRGDILNFTYIYSLVQKGFAQNPDEKAIIMYEIGSEKAESVYMLRLIMEMIEAGIKPEDLKMENVGDLEKEPKDLKERLIREFFDLSNAELMRELQMIKEHAFDPLREMLWTTKLQHTWTGRAAIQRGSSPEEVEREKYR